MIVIFICGACNIGNYFLADPTGNLFSLVYIIEALFVSQMFESSRTLLSKVKNKKARATLFSAWALCGTTGQIISAKLFGWLYSAVGPQFPVFVTGIINMV